MLYTNHSCDPNIGLQGQIVFVAMRDIAAGEELTHDWGSGVDPSASGRGPSFSGKTPELLGQVPELLGNEPLRDVVDGRRNGWIGIDLFPESPHGSDKEVRKGKRHGLAQVQDSAAESRSLIAGSGSQSVDLAPILDVAAIQDLSQHLVAFKRQPVAIPKR